MDSVFDNRPTDLKRKVESTDVAGRKIFRYNSIIEAVKTMEYNEESTEELKRLVALDLDINEADDFGWNPLFYAVYSNREAWITTLLEYGADPSLAHFLNERGFTDTATDIAWSCSRFEQLLCLLNADGPFPQDFHEEKLNSLTMLHKFSIELILNSRKDFHANIEADQFDAVSMFIKENPKARYVYDGNNNCALSSALIKKNFGMYAFLRSKGFASGLDQNHDLLMTNLGHDKAILRSKIQNYFKSANIHILDLVSKSRLGFDNDHKNFSKIQRFFEHLDEVPKIQPILKLLANQQNLSIVFDFNRSSICGVDVTRCFNENVKGRTYTNSGQIVIGAKRVKNQATHGEHCDLEVLGTLAHEMAHYAMNLMYNNGCRPYRDDDHVRKEEFKEVTTDTMMSEEVVIGNVYNNYEPEKWPAELIVRVPHLMALLSMDTRKFDEIREAHRPLFNFYDRHFLPEAEKELSRIEPKRKVQELNKVLGTLFSLKSSNVRCEKTKNELAETFTGSSNSLICTRVPKFVMSSVITAFNIRDVESSYIFITAEQLMDSDNRAVIRDIVTADFQPLLLILDSLDVKASVFDAVLDEFSSKTRIVLISSRMDVDLKNIPQMVDVDIGWMDLSDDDKQEILDTTILFQDSMVALKDLLAVDSELWLKLALDEIFDIKALKLTEFERNLPPLADVFIERTFKKISSDGTEKITVDKVIAQLDKLKTLVLADSAGMGKTTSAISLAKKLKQKNPLSWVVFMDLKRYTAHYLKDDQNQPSTIDVEFFSQSLWHFESTFEQRLFEQLYQSSKIIFVVDGFDEISPSFKKFVLKIMKAIQQSRNRLLATTRVHLSDELEIKLGVRAITFNPFNAENQKEFLTSFWKETPHEQEVDMQAKVKSVLDKLRRTLGHEFLEVPLQLFMLAEISEIQQTTDFEENVLNYYSLYERFITSKIDIWINRGQLALDDNTSLHKSPFNVLQMHQKIALEYFFGKDAVTPMLLPKIHKPLTDELISRIGIMKVTTEAEFLFIHQTFAEFLVAAFILANVLMKTPLSSYHALHRILLSVFSDEKYANIRKFVDGNLAIMTGAVETEDLAQKLQESLKIASNRAFLSQMVEEKHLKIVSLVLTRLAMEKSTKLQLVQHRASNVGNTMHVAIKHFESFEVLWHCVASFAEQNDLKELLFTLGWSGNVLGCCIKLKAEEVLKIVLQFCKSAMNADEVNRLVSHQHEDRRGSSTTVLQEAAKYVVDFPAFEVLWDTIDEKLGREDQKKLLQLGDVDEFYGFLYNLENNSMAMTSTLKAFETMYSRDELQNFLGQESLLWNVLAFFAENADPDVLRTFCEFVQQFLTEARQRILLLRRNTDNEHIFLFSNDFKDTTKLLFSIATKLLGPEDFYDVLFTVHEDGRLGFGTAFDSASLETIGEVLRSLDSESTRRHIREYLMKIDKRGEHILHRILGFNNGKEPEDLFKFMKNHLVVADIKALAFHKDNKGNNIAFYLVENAKEVATLMVFWAINCFTNQDYERLMNERDNSSQNLLHLACSKGNHEVPNLLDPFFDSCLVYCNYLGLDFKPMMLAVDDCGRTPLESSLHNENSTEGIFELAWKAYEKILTHEELEKVVFGGTNDFFSIHDGKCRSILRHLVKRVVAKFGRDRVLNRSESARSWIENN